MESVDVGVTETVLGLLIGGLALLGTLAAVLYQKVFKRPASKDLREDNEEDLAEAKASHTAATEEAEAKIKDSKAEAAVKLKALADVVRIEDRAERAEALTDLHNKDKDRST